MAQVMYYFRYPGGDFTMPSSSYRIRCGSERFYAPMWLGDRFANAEFDEENNPGYPKYDFNGHFDA